MSSGRGKSGGAQARSNKFCHINCPSSFHLIALIQRHAPANFALQRILSEKLQFLCFSQVPAGSDCLFFKAIGGTSDYSPFFIISRQTECRSLRERYSLRNMQKRAASPRQTPLFVEYFLFGLPICLYANPSDYSSKCLLSNSSTTGTVMVDWFSALKARAKKIQVLKMSIA